MSGQILLHVLLDMDAPNANILSFEFAIVITLSLLHIFFPVLYCATLAKQTSAK